MQPQNSQEALSAVQQAQSQAQDPNAYLSQQRQQLGVNDAQSTVTGLRGAINNTTKLLQQVAPSIMGRTSSSLVNAAQAQRQIANEQAPISDTLNQQGSQYTEAGSNLSRLEQQASQAAAGQYQGQQDKLSYLQNIYNNLYQREQDAATLAEQQRQFDAAQRAAAAFQYSNPTGGGTPAASTQTNRQAYDSSIQGLENELKNGRAPSYEAAVNNAINEFAGKGISPQEIGNYLYDLYGRYFNTSQTKKFYGDNNAFNNSVQSPARSNPSIAPTSVVTSNLNALGIKPMGLR